jgi:PPOX class probable FMN-dependent enzyme
MTNAGPMTEITSRSELRELIGEPMPIAANKLRTTLTGIHRDWLAASPMCLIATTDRLGNCDVSPKGDPAGFTYVLDDATLAIPDRPGNRRIDGWMNVLENPHVALIYLIPGRGDTLRINGRARLIRQAPFFDRLVVEGNRPKVALLVDIDEVFFHCSKAFLRAKLWDPQSWDPGALPSVAQIAHGLGHTGQSLAQLTERYGPTYVNGLYPS